jgi:hypothetical protein
MLKTWKAPTLEDSMEQTQSLLLWPIYIDEKGRTLGKTYGIKVRCYWNTLAEHIGNLMGT